MNRFKLFILLLLSQFTILSAQGVGVNRTTPKATLEVTPQEGRDPAQPQGIIFPRISTAERTAFQDVEVGTLIYNTTKKCIEMYVGYINGVHTWTCNRTTAPPVNNGSVTVSPAGFSGTAVAGVPMGASNTVKWTLTNNGTQPLTCVDLSHAVTLSGNNSSLYVNAGQNTCVNIPVGGSVTLSYSMGGTPTYGSAISADFNYLYLSAQQQQPVNYGSATFSDVVKVVISSVGIQGYINNTDHVMNIQIPYTGGAGYYPASTATVTTAPGEGGDVNTLTLNIPEGYYNGSGTLSGTIAVSGSDLEHLVKQMQPGQSYTVATIPITIGAQTTNIVIRGVGAWFSTKTVTVSKLLTKNDCTAPYFGSTQYFTQSATATGMSIVSQADADNIATNNATAKLAAQEASAQQQLNATGYCNIMVREVRWGCYETAIGALPYTTWETAANPASIGCPEGSFLSVKYGPWVPYYK